MIEEFSIQLGLQVTGLSSLSGGKNSRVYKLYTEKEGKCFVAKLYPQIIHDKRDRLNVEFKAFKYLHENRIQLVPQAFIKNEKKRYAIYSYIEGSKPSLTSVKPSDLDQAVAFLATLKALSQKKDSRKIPMASEACFSGKALVRNIESRLSQLSCCDNSLLQTFIIDKLLPEWSQVIAELQRPNGDKNIYSEEIPFSNRTLSPSDFGFHNAIMDSSGVFYYVDFEYFGWDDPSKTVCDFILHPAMQLDLEMQITFANKIKPIYDQSGDFNKRLIRLFPLYVIKWTLIILNEFIPAIFERRERAAGCKLDSNRIKTEQLNKAEKMLDRVWKVGDLFAY